MTCLLHTTISLRLPEIFAGYCYIPGVFYIRSRDFEGIRLILTVLLHGSFGTKYYPLAGNLSADFTSAMLTYRYPAFYNTFGIKRYIVIA